MKMEDLNKILMEPLKDILKKECKIDPDEKKRNRKIVMDVVKNLKIKMNCEDSLFQELFINFCLSGSYFEGLRIKSASEFDINMVLKIPHYAESMFIVKELNKIPSFAMAELHSRMMFGESSPINKFESFFNTNNFLSPEKVLSWFQGLIDKVINKITHPEVQKITTSSSGPARTLLITLNTGQTLSVDLVPVFKIKGSLLKKYKRSFVEIKHLKIWYLVPKPYKPSEEFPVLKNVHLWWRVHCPAAEKNIIKNRQALKPVIKLIKLLRDKEEWISLPSYYIKTVAFWLIEKNPDPHHWEEKFLGRNFIEMLKSLDEAVATHHLKHYFYPEFNLLYRMNDKDSERIHNRIQKILKTIESKPKNVRKFFKR